MSRDDPDRGKKIEERVRFDAIRYANCWEDADILMTALEPASLTPS